MTNEEPTVATVLFEVRDGVAHVTLNRPEAMNSLNSRLLAELSDAMDQVSADPQIKAVVITGSGERAFSAGVDLKAHQKEGIMHDAGKHLTFSAELRDIFIKIEQTRVPVIAVIRGYALAGGLELALCCDLIVCSDDAQIGDQHANRNLIAGGGGTQRLPRRIGQQRAMELLFTGRRLSGKEAVGYGLALRSYPSSELDAGVEELLAQLRTKSRVGLGFMKELVQRGTEMPLREALDLERLIVQEYFSCFPDASSGVAAFNEQRANAQ